jgi:hypothetical protein
LHASCAACGRYLTRPPGGAAARFWEGGEGQRNRAMLSRTDPRKFKGGNKTASQKAARVGAAGAAARDAAAAARA